MKYFCGYYKQMFPKLLALVWHKSNKIARLFRITILSHRKFPKNMDNVFDDSHQSVRKSSHSDLAGIFFTNHPAGL